MKYDNMRRCQLLYMKKSLFLLLCLFIALPSWGEALTIWTSSENVRKAILTLSHTFEKEYDVKVQIDVLNKDLTTQFKTAAMTGKGPDILCWAHDIVGELAESGLIEPLDIDTKFKAQFLETAIKAYTYKGKVYGYPYDIEAVALIYNKDLLASPPKNMEEVFVLHSQFKKQGKFAFLYDIKNFFFTFPIFASNGAYIFGEEVHDIGLNNSGAVKSTNFLKSLIDKKVVPISTDRGIAFGKMKEGKLALTIDGPWSINDLEKSKINYGIAPIPSIAGESAKPFVGTHGFIIRRSSKKKALAKELIENYLVSKEGIITLYKEDPRGPSRKDALEVLAKDYPNLTSFFKSAENGIPMPNVPEMGAVWGAMGNSMDLIFSGRMKTQEGLDLAVKQIKNSINSTGKK